MKRFLSAPLRVCFSRQGHSFSGPTRHPEAYLEVARNWPHEEFAADSYVDASSAFEYPPSTLVFPSDHPNGEETHSYRATLANRVVTSLLAIGLTGIVGWRIHDTFDLKTTLADKIGVILDAHKASILPNDARIIALNQELANERLLFTEQVYHRNPTHRILFDGAFERASDRLISPGSQANLETLDIKHTWQRTSDLDKAFAALTKEK